MAKVLTVRNGGLDMDSVQQRTSEIEILEKHLGLDAMDAKDFFTQLVTSWDKADVIKGDGKVESRRILIAGDAFFVKRYCFSGNVSMWLYKCGFHKYCRMRTALRAMMASYIATPPLYRIMIDESLKRLFTVSAYEAGGKDLRHLIGRDLDKIFSEKNITEQMATIMTSLHGRACVLHGDFKWANILYDQKHNRLTLVDLDSARKLNAQSRRFYRDVARFVVDCDEAELSQDHINGFLALYGRHNGKHVDEIWSLISADYHKFKKRHVKKYGEGFKLANPGKVNPS